MGKHSLHIPSAVSSQCDIGNMHGLVTALSVTDDTPVLNTYFNPFKSFWLGYP